MGKREKKGGPEENRTPDLPHAKRALYQLSYEPLLILLYVKITVYKPKPESPRTSVSEFCGPPLRALPCTAPEPPSFSKQTGITPEVQETPQWLGALGAPAEEALQKSNGWRGVLAPGRRRWRGDLGDPS